MVALSSTSATKFMGGGWKGENAVNHAALSQQFSPITSSRLKTMSFMRTTVDYLFSVSETP